MRDIFTLQLRKKILIYICSYLHLINLVFFLNFFKMILLIIIIVEEVMEDFRHNGRDFEYCPDLDIDVTRQIMPRRKKNKKPLPTECVFCRNNGEEEAYYRKHLLKDIDGRVSCPVLRYSLTIMLKCVCSAEQFKFNSNVKMHRTLVFVSENTFHRYIA